MGSYLKTICNKRPHYGSTGGNNVTAAGWTGLTGACGNILPKPEPALPPAKPAPEQVGGGEFTFSSYGAFIPRIYGSYVVSGNVFWHSGWGKFTFRDGGVSKFIYLTNFALGLCEGSIDDVLRVWIGTKLVIDRRITVDGSGIAQADDEGVIARATISGEALGITGAPGYGGARVTVFKGTEYQVTPAIMETVEGVGNSPGYRGMAYILFEDFAFGETSTPDIRVEVLANSNPVYAHITGQATDTGLFDVLAPGTAYDPAFNVYYRTARAVALSEGADDGFVSFDASNLA